MLVTLAKILDQRSIIDKFRIQFSQGPSTFLPSASLSHIQRSKTIKDLLKNIDYRKTFEQPTFKALMYKLTSLMQEQKCLDKQTIERIEKFYSIIRINLAVQMTPSNSQILNLHLFIKLKSNFYQSNYKSKSFQNRLNIVSEQILKSSMFNQRDALANSLLHYIANVAGHMQLNLHLAIFNYFHRLNTAKKIQQSQDLKTLGIQKLSEQLISSIILLKESESSEFKAVPNSHVTEVALINLNVNYKKINLHLRVDELAKLYDKFVVSQLDFQNMSANQKQAWIKGLLQNQFIKTLNEKYQRSQKQTPIINTLEKFLQICHYFTQLIQIDQKQMLINQIDRRQGFNLLKYFYSVFMLSQGLTVKLSKNRDILFKKPQIMDKGSEGVKIMPLWKISYQILSLIQKRFHYVHKKNDLLKIITFKVLQFIKDNVKLSNQFEKIPELTGNLTTFIGVLSVLPIKQLHQCSNICLNLNEKIAKAVKICVKHSADNQLIELSKCLLNLIKFKKNLFISKEDWIQIFKMAIARDKNLQLYNLYFFLASTSDSNFINLIPFDSMIQYLSIWRQKLQKMNSYAAPSNLQNINYTMPVEKIIQQLSESRSWDSHLLRIDALLLLSNKQQQLNRLLKNNCPKYVITKQQLERLYHSWLSPYNQYMLAVIRKFELHEAKTSDGSPLYIKPHIFLKILPCYSNYFNTIFIQTECSKQFKLLHKIIMGANFDSWLKLKRLPQQNFTHYFMTLILGLGDPVHKETYLKTYPFSEIDFNGINKLHLFKYVYEKQVMEFKNIEQWQYLLKFYDNLKVSIHLRNIYNGYLHQQQLYKSVVVSKQGKEESCRLDLNIKYSYNDGGLGKYSKDAYNKITRLMINSFIQDLKNMLKIKATSKSTEKKLCIYAHLLYEIAFLNSKQYEINIREFMDQESIKESQSIFDSIPQLAGQYINKSIHLLGQLGLLSEQNIIEILKHSSDYRAVNRIQLTCLRLLGYSKAAQLFPAQLKKMEQVQNQVYIISSNIKCSLNWFLNTIFICDPARFQNFVFIYQTFYDPVQRMSAFKQILKKQQKYKLNQYTLKFQPEYNRQFISKAHQKSNKIGDIQDKQGYEYVNEIDLIKEFEDVSDEIQSGIESNLRGNQQGQKNKANYKKDMLKKKTLFSKKNKAV